MFSERLEKLIQSSLQDGILTDQEKTAILKRAKAEGEDIDEVEIYIESLLQKRKKELNNSDVKVKANTSSMDDLKKLIDAAMADGVITSKEREVIIKKAAVLGIDAAEAEVYLDAEIQKVEQAAEQVKRDKIGPVCPKCGKQVPPLTLVCECGYEFTKDKRVSSVQVLFEKIENIQNGNNSPDRIQKKVLDAINLFPVPNTKEDIIDFLALAAPNAKRKGGFLGTMMNRFLLVAIIVIIIIVICVIMATTAKNSDDNVWPILAIFYLGGGAAAAGYYLATKVDLDTIEWNKKAAVWRSKFDQVIIKGRSLRGDPEFTQQLNYYENMFKK